MSGGAVTLFLCGDVMLGRGIDQVLPSSCPPRLYEPFAGSALDYVELAERAHGPIRRPLAYAEVWGDALEILRREAPAARIVNLETSVTVSEAAAPKGINYRMHPGNIPVLGAAGVDCCVLANNHVLDWGAAGLLETLDTLTRSGIAFAGAGRDLEAAAAPAVLPAGDGTRVLVFGFGTTDSGIPRGWAAGPGTPGVHLLRDLSSRTVERIARLVRASRRPGDIAVASIHWGPNWGYGIPWSHRRFAHGLIDRAGIDVVHGHSSHHPLAIELHGGRPVLYGCGDFLNDYEGISGHEEFRGDLALMYFPGFEPETGRLLRLRLVPLQIRSFRLRRPEARDLAWLGDVLERECRRFGTDVRVEDGGLSVEW